MALYVPLALEELSHIEDWGTYATRFAHHVIEADEIVGDILLSILVVHLTFVKEGDNPTFWLERLEDIIRQAKEVEAVESDA